MTQIGDRVGAIQKANDKTVYLYGYGIYEGKTVPPENAGGFNIGIPNPTTKLDSGETVYGCECWWGPEEKIKGIIGNRKVIIVEPLRE